MSAVILEKGERVDSLYGREDVTITDEMIEALKDGKRILITVQGEYVVVLKKNQL